eukprot:8640285-Pyramimonas_sp.AAC.1
MCFRKSPDRGLVPPAQRCAEVVAPRGRNRRMSSVRQPCRSAKSGSRLRRNDNTTCITTSGTARKS